ncbi:MAG: DUF134 domain-containing protein [Clostridia bacterium]|jgi:predicted DNA-binding protein (UPF0251 family)|nr:DUF134 domain-containing protein [Clostridia bacterium]
MSRSRIKRNCRDLENDIRYSSLRRGKSGEAVIIEIEEFEAMRLCDYEGKNQIETAEIMDTSRGTVQRLLTAARKKMLHAILTDSCMVIKKD